MKYCVVFITATKKESKGLAKLLLTKKLCACVNIVDNLRSLFWWQGKIDSAKESLLIAKTKMKLMPELINTVRSAHSYDVCEVIALPIWTGNKEYLDWVGKSCKG